MQKLIINVAVCGSAPTRQQNPAIPHTPKEIAEEALRCWRAGATVVHVHVREPESGEPAFRRDLFAEVLERIRAESDMLVNLTTSGFNLQGEDPGEERLVPVALKPDLCSLDVGSLNFRGRVFLNPTDWVDKAAQRMRETGVKPEIEVFELGHLRQALDMIKRGLIADPPYFQFCLGIPWGAPADLPTLMAFRERLPEGIPWSVLGVGAAQLPVTTHAMLMGGHVRVGFEDNLYLSKGVPADSNARFVERVVRLAKELHREVATCDEAREMLNIPPKP
ncbi:MAG: 3-keto-5-aminohexanoate cleavage protein [Desulfarculaceae bacterium]|nr:3-keto-5-aminohexanoate cleavage protein [Desulfarculaceae bacterium]